MSYDIAKAGWLYRQSSVLRRWKRNWFVLYTDGVLKYFESPDSHTAEEAELIPTKLLSLKTAEQVTDVTPPQGLGRGCLMMLVMRSQTWVLCADSPDDMRAWQLSLEEARLLHMVDAPPPYQAVTYVNDAPNVYPTGPYAPPNNYVYYGPHPPPYVVQSPAGTQTTVIYAPADGPYYYHRRGGYDGTDMALGMVAGAALGSMMWGPLLWW
jgi:hypothetical protein